MSVGDELNAPVFHESNAVKPGSQDTRNWQFGSRGLITIETLLITLLGSVVYISSLPKNGLSPLDWISIACFMILFSWISFSFVAATIGMVHMLRKEKTLVPRRQRPIASFPPTAVLVPVYNEDPKQVAANVHAMIESLDRDRDGCQFDFFILSDTVRVEIWLEEEAIWSELSKSVSPRHNLYYRNRAENIARKSGNIADFCERWGSEYDLMIVLDADSLMSGDTMREMVCRMQRDPAIGILQVPPVPIGHHSLFARLQQFASQVYGPVFASGISQWSGNDGNYWGHNAIIRVKPFIDHCDLPKLDGTPPLGGEILSHDFVEAAMLVKEGWKVVLAHDLGGSYEECPTTIEDFAIRDRRWCQGNLQHTTLLLAEGFKPLSRFHFANGIMAYLSSPIWSLFLVTTTLSMLFDSNPNNGSPKFQSLSVFLFMAVMGMLLLPKLWGLLTVARDPVRLQGFGGKRKLLLGVLIESACSIVLAPIMAVYHTLFVLCTISGFKCEWNAQNRGETSVRFSTAAKQYWILSFTASLIAVLLLVYAPSLLLWTFPLLIGPTLAIPISVLMASPKLGRSLHDRNILATPDETNPSDLIRAQQRYRQLDLIESGIDVPKRDLEDVVENSHSLLRHMTIQKGYGQNKSLDERLRNEIVNSFAAGRFDLKKTQIAREILLDIELLSVLHKISRTRGSETSLTDVATKAEQR